MANTNPKPFEPIKIFNYVETLSKCCKSINETTYKKAISAGPLCLKAVQHYFHTSAYPNSGQPLQPFAPINANMAPEFVTAFFAALKFFKKLDPPTNQYLYPQSANPLNAVLEEIVYATGTLVNAAAADPTQAQVQAAMAGGGNFDLKKIIKLTKNEQEGYVPYDVNNIAGTYTDEYLEEMNLKIKKVYNQFGGFKKVSKEVIGSLEDLDRFLREDLLNQVNNSVFSKYYKSYPVTYQTGGVLAAHGKAVKDAYDLYVAASPAHREVFDSFGNFVYYTQSAPGNYTYSRLLKGEDINALPAGFVRFNLTHLDVTSLPAGDYQGYRTAVNNHFGGNAVYGASFNPAPPQINRQGQARKIPILLTMLPDSGGGNYNDVLKTAVAYWYTAAQLDDAVGGGPGAASTLSQIGGIPANGAPADQINTTRPSLDKIVGCDDEVYDNLIRGDAEGEDVETNTKTQFDKKYWNRDVRYDENTKRMQYKNKISKKWEDIIDPTDKENYTKYFNTQKKCFNSYFKTNTHQECCDLMKHLMNGDYKKFLDLVSGKNGAPALTFDALETSFKEVNPYTVVKFLEGFGFRKVQEYNVIHGTVYKFPCYAYWKKNILKTLDLTTIQKNNLETMPNLDLLLDMSVAFVNDNPNILNPGIDPMADTSSKDEELEKRGVLRFRMRNPEINKLSWGPVSSRIRGNIAKFMRPYYTSPVLPIGLFGGQQFTAHFGGGNNKNVEIVLDQTDIVPQFASHIADDLKTLINSLKSNNKFIRSSEMKEINDMLNNYADLEVKLFQKILLINKYIKVAYYLNDNDREYLSDSKIQNYINQYLEIFKDFSNKDIELKNLGSILKGIVNDKL